jgi:hypothetical protein
MMSIRQTIKIKIMKTFLELGLALELRRDLSDKGIHINENYVIKVFGTSIEFILDDGEGKKVFGADVNVYGYRNGFSEDGAREVKINAGSMGAVDNTCVATVAKHNLMSTALNNWEEFVESCEVVMDEFESISREELKK